MSASLVVLERFDARAPRRDGDEAPANVFEQRLRAEAFAEGYAAGEAAASARGDAEARFMAGLAAALEAEAVAAPREIATQAGQALRVLIERIFPTLIEKGFAAEAAAAFARAVKDAPGRTLDIRTAPDRAEALRALLQKTAPDAPVSIIADPALKDAAVAHWAGGGLEFDLDAAAREIIAAFDSALNKTESEKQP